MPPNPERQERMRQRRQQMENDPELNAAREAAGSAVLGDDSQFERLDDIDWNTGKPVAPAPVVPRPPAPPLNAPPIGQPTVPGQPQVRARPSPGMRGGGGMPQRGPLPAPSAPPVIAPRQVNPLGLSPGSPFRYNEGGMVQKHGSSTCVHSMTKHRS
jgi:hypothetical protein